MQDFYKIIPSSFLDKPTSYKRQSVLKLELPLRALIIGPSGSRKTNSLFNIIKALGAFTRIFLYCKCLTEPLYSALIALLEEFEQKTGRKIITASSDINDIGSPDDYDSSENNLIIIDDMITESSKNLKKVSELFIRGRKHSISTIFLSQNFYSVPKIIRSNISVLILKKLSSTKDLQLILRENSLSKTMPEIKKMYNYVIKQGPLNFFMIDLTTMDEKLVYRMNFTPLLN
jgi:hypothetical protein